MTNKFLELYINNKIRLNYSQATIKVNKIYITHFIEDNPDFISYVPEDIQLYIDKLGSRYKSNSARSIYRTVKNFYDFLNDFEYRPHNTKRLQNRYSEVKESKNVVNKKKFLEISRNTSVVKCIDNYRVDFLMTLLYTTGCRVHEIMNIDIIDIVGPKTQLCILGKGRKYRPIAITNNTKQKGRDYYIERKLYALDNGHNGSNTNIFINHCKSQFGNSIMTVRSLERWVQIVSKKEDIYIYPHLFRHSYATALLEGGIRIDDISRFLGHTNINTTSRYLRPSQEHLQSAIDKLNK